jgi:peptide/nickel transport system substrate-binding protein
MVGLLASAGAGCGRAPDVDRVTGERPIELSVQQDVETFDPRYASDAYSLRASRLIHAGLVRLDPDTLEPVPYLAKSWQWTGPLTLHVELRDDVRFHSGAPLTPADVAKTIEAFQSPEVASRHLRIVEAIARVEADGPHAVNVVLARPHATLITDLEVPILRADQAFSPPDPDGALDGLGPYRVARATRGDVLLEPASGSPLPRPAHAVVVRTVHDDNARALRLLAGKSDVALNVIALAPALDGHDGLRVVERPGANITYLVARLNRGPFADVRLRRAISLGIDRAGLAATLFEHHVDAAYTLIPPMHWAYAAMPPIPFDPAGARALVAEALGSSTARVHATLLTSTDRFRTTVGRAMAQELEDAGIDVDVTPLELGTMLARLNAGDFELAVLQFPEFSEPNILRNLLHSTFVPPIGYNRAHVSDPELDALLAAGDTRSDIEERKRIYAKVEERVREGVYLVPLWNEHQLTVDSERAKGFRLSAEGRWLGLAGIR